MSNPKKFDANTWDDQVVLSTDFISGSYHIEGEDCSKSVWMSDNASVVLANDKEKSSICIKGYVNMELLNQIGINEQAFDFYINGEKIFTDKVSESGAVSFVLNKNGIGL